MENGPFSGISSESVVCAPPMHGPVVYTTMIRVPGVAFYGVGSERFDRCPPFTGFLPFVKPSIGSMLPTIGPRFALMESFRYMCVNESSVQPKSSVPWEVMP